MRTQAVALCLLTACGMYITEDEIAARVDADLDGVIAADDCDDGDDSASELTIWYGDSDGDGVGGDTTIEECHAPDGFVATTGDCDDANGDVVDEGIYYLDIDEDGFGDDLTEEVLCGQPPGHVEQGGDCNDGDTAINPNAAEVCDDGIDNDCDGLADDDDPDTLFPPWFVDGDEDGYGGDEWPTDEDACEPPTGAVLVSGDCDDEEAAATPVGLEICDDIDNDCNGETDDADAGLLDAPTWYLDTDEDSFGDPYTAVIACDPGIGNFVADGTDCEDTDNTIHPDQPSEDHTTPDDGAACFDGFDNDCDGKFDTEDILDCDDEDGDGRTQHTDPVFPWDDDGDGTYDHICGRIDDLFTGLSTDVDAFMMPLPPDPDTQPPHRMEADGVVAGAFCIVLDALQDGGPSEVGFLSTTADVLGDEVCDDWLDDQMQYDRWCDGSEGFIDAYCIELQCGLLDCDTCPGCGYAISNPYATDVNPDPGCGGPPA